MNELNPQEFKDKVLEILREKTSDFFVPHHTHNGIDSVKLSATTSIEGGVGSKISIVTGNLSVSTSNVETNLISVSVPGGTLSLSNGVRAVLNISSVLASAGGTLTIRFKYGSTTLVTSADVAPSTAACSGWIEATLLATGSIATQEGILNVFLQQEGRDNTGLRQTYDYGSGTSTENSASALNLVISAQFSVANANNFISMENAIIEKII